MFQRGEPLFQRQALQGVLLVMSDIQLVLVFRIDHVEFHAAELSFFDLGAERVVHSVRPHLVLRQLKPAVKQRGTLLGVTGGEPDGQEDPSNMKKRSFHSFVALSPQI